MSKVFVTQENTRLNYTDAERFGEVVFMSYHEFSPNKNSKRNADIIEELRDHIEGNFDPDQDCLLLSGDPVIMSYSFHLAMQKKGYVRLLKWDNQTRRYNEIHIA
jgi:hypothetical protein